MISSTGRSGNAALAFGAVAVLFVFVPVAGDFIAGAAGLAALVAGYIGFDRVDQGVATNRGDAIVGAGLGALALMIMLVVFAAASNAAPV